MLDITELEPKIANAAKLMEMLSQPVRLRLLCGECEVIAACNVAPS